MKKGFTPMSGVDGWQLSNFPVLSGAAHLASLAIFDQAGMKALRAKSVKLTGYLADLLQGIDAKCEKFVVITPSEPSSRGSQLSILMRNNGRKVFDTLTKHGVIADWREPGLFVWLIPLYNTFEDVYRFAEIFSRSL